MNGIKFRLESKKSGKQMLLILRRQKHQILQLNKGLDGASKFMVHLLQGLDDGTIEEGSLKDLKEQWLQELLHASSLHFIYIYIERDVSQSRVVQCQASAVSSTCASHELQSEM